MKLQDIPKLIPEGDYEIAIGLKYLESTLKDYEEDYGLELNPDFQRGHVWSEEQQIAYVEFFLKGGKTAKTIYFSCPYFKNGTYEEYLSGKYDYPMVCVDGLQRLTALRKFLNNELKIFGHYLNEYEDKDIFLRRINSLRFNINDLPKKKDVLKWYLEMNTGGTPHSKEEINRVTNMLNNTK
ncbi:MAG: DUF262 domain-containing protein [Clostridium perfringens]|jgi:uncharacterized protein with ParB-like and HNH nuclease domain|nr:DUF262 domain-containing protein [Clostridium perfringens]